ncbi:MAG: hypothetical protein AABX51_08970 [Nanoarchaeota archaeon]
MLPTADLTDIKTHIEKIITDNDERLRVLAARHNLLEEAERSMERIVSDPSLMNRFIAFVSADKQFILDVEREYGELSRVISQKLSELREQSKSLKGVDKTLNLVKPNAESKATMSFKEAIAYLESVEKFIQSIKRHLSVIDDRVKLEMQFLLKRDTVSFEGFLTAWDGEMMENQEILNDYERLSRDSQGHIQKIRDLKDGLTLAAVGSGMAAFPFAPAVLAGQTLTNIGVHGQVASLAGSPEFVLGLTALTFVAGFASLIMGFERAMRQKKEYSITEVRADHSLIRDVKSKMKKLLSRKQQLSYSP